jgi:MazG family protein
MDAIDRLDALTHRLRAECPWDREQDERSIVPHTVEEAYELADAAMSGDDGKLLDELGDVLFQVHFLALLLEERGAGDLAAVAEHCRQKLIRRHPHVFAASSADDPVKVKKQWDEIKTEEKRERDERRARRGISEDFKSGHLGSVPRSMPALVEALKLQQQAVIT